VRRDEMGIRFKSGTVPAAVIAGFSKMKNNGFFKNTTVSFEMGRLGKTRQKSEDQPFLIFYL